MRHFEMVEHHIVIADGSKESDTERRICGHCCYRDEQGRHRSASWPCDYERLRLACHQEIPDGAAITISGYGCLLCGWGADPSMPETHEPSCLLYETAAGGGRE